MTSGSDRLTGWKAIAAFLAVDVRTARRWEDERGLPVRRLPGDNRSAVWADPVELRAWMAGPPEAAPPPAVPSQRSTPAAPPLRALALVALVLLLVAGLWWWLRQPTALAAPFADPVANRIWLDAGHAAASRSPAGLEQAERLYADLARRHPRAAAPQAGLAETWLLMREFAGLADEAAFRRARDAAETALALEPTNAQAQRVLGFVLFWTEVDQARGLDLLRAANGVGTDARALHWLATALAFSGREAEALPLLSRARLLAPESSAIAADEAQVRFMMGEHASALATLHGLSRSDPDFIGAWRYLEWDLLAEGNAPGFLAAARQHARLSRDPARLVVLDRAEAAFRTAAMPGLIDVLIADAERRHRTTGSDAVTIARLHALAGDRAAVRRWISLAQSRREPFAHMLSGWPELRPLQRDPALADLFARRPAMRPA